MDTILYFGDRFDALDVRLQPGARVAEDGAVHSSDRRFVAMDDLQRAVAYLRHRPVSALLIDARGGALEHAHALLDALFPSGRMGGPVLRQRVIALVEPFDVESAFSLGRHGIGGVLPTASGAAVQAHLDALLKHRGHGKVAICLAGGGIEGLLYELGVLRALEACLKSRPIVDMDFFCGISAGAILGSLLANGVGPNEIMRALEGSPSRRLAPLERWDIFEPNVSEVGRRLFTLVTELLRGGDGPRGAVSSLTRAVPNAAFSGRRLGRWLERQLTRPGMTNRFDELRRPLYVGATDQDSAEAVLFGDGDFRHVPIHRAVHASTALIPFYPPVEVDGRYYIDGAFTRTTNMRTAAKMGATLVILIDPLVPMRSPSAGYVASRGGIYSTTQGLKALINGRFDKAVNAICEMYPHVAFHLFRPEDDEMRVLSGSPMKYFYRQEIADIAYEASLKKIKERYALLARDFELHGIELEHPDGRASVRPPPPLALAPSDFGIH